MKKCMVVTTIITIVSILAVGCAGAKSPSVAPSTSPSPEITPTPQELTPGTADSGFFLTVTQPANESIISTDKVGVTGITVPKAVVSVNGALADLDKEGNFNTIIFLEEGPNLIEVVASDLEGNQESNPIVVIYVPPETLVNNFFLTVTQPIDNSTTNSDEIEVKGRTSPGAVITVNGELVEIEEGGNFSTTVFLEEGPNLIEIIASDLEGNQEHRNLVVIHVP